MLAPTAAVVRSRNRVVRRFGDMYLTFGSASSAEKRLEDTDTLTALIELKTFFIWPYCASCCSSSLVGGVLNCTITSTSPLDLPVGRSLASFGPAKAIAVKLSNAEI